MFSKDLTIQERTLFAVLLVRKRASESLNGADTVEEQTWQSKAKSSIAQHTSARNDGTSRLLIHGKSTTLSKRVHALWQSKAELDLTPRNSSFHPIDEAHTLYVLSPKK
jgi:hypothetical protein